MLVSTIADFPPEMVALMDKTVHPCTNFYQYTCGKWVKENNPKSRDPKLRRAFDMIEQNKGEMIIQIAKRKPPLLGEFWDSCMDLNKITKLGNIPFQKDLKRIVNTKTKQELMTLSGEFSRTGTQTFFKISVEESMGKHKLEIKPLLFPHYLGKSDANYLTYMKELMEISGLAHKLKHEIPRMVETVKKMEFDIFMFNVPSRSVLNWANTDSHYMDLTISKAKTRWPISFGAVWNGVQQNINTKFTIKSLYFNELEKWINDASLNDLKTWVAFRMIHSRVLWLGEPYYKIWHKYFGNKIHHLKEIPTREMICKDSLLTYVPDLIGKYYNEETLKPVIEMTNSMKASLNNQISQSKWVDQNDKKGALSKLNKFMSFIFTERPKSYPLTMSHDNYPSNVYHSLSILFDFKMKTIGHRVKTNEWSEFTQQMNKEYVPKTVKMSFPGTILQPPYFNGPHIHPSRNFGAIGFIMGRELTLGFEHGADQLGTSKDLWSLKTRKAFEVVEKCFNDQYGKMYDEYETNIGRFRENDVLKVRENLVDNGGLTLAWEAYRKHVMGIQSMENGAGDSIDKGDQMFFIAFGQSLCARSDYAIVRHQLRGGKYSPAQERVNGVVMNSEQFAKVFQCDTNTPMNPIEKCTIW